MTERHSQYILRTEASTDGTEALTPRYLTVAQAAKEVEQWTGADRDAIAADLEQGHTFENTNPEGVTRTWSPLSVAVERWILWHPNTSSATSFTTLDAAVIHQATLPDPTEFAISPVYA